MQCRERRAATASSSQASNDAAEALRPQQLEGLSRCASIDGSVANVMRYSLDPAGPAGARWRRARGLPCWDSGAPARHGDARAPDDLRRARARPAQLDQAVDRRVEQPGPRGGAPLGLGQPRGDRGHPSPLAVSTAWFHTVKPVWNRPQVSSTGWAERRVMRSETEPASAVVAW